MDGDRVLDRFMDGDRVRDRFFDNDRVRSRFLDGDRVRDRFIDGDRDFILETDRFFDGDRDFLIDLDSDRFATGDGSLLSTKGDFERDFDLDFERDLFDPDGDDRARDRDNVFIDRIPDNERSDPFDP